MTVNNADILKIVTDIEAEYIKNLPPPYDVLYSKLAVMEFCGWIEQTFDDILKNYINNKLQLQTNKNYIEKEIIRRNSNFNYDNNFRKMLLNIIGIKNLEKFEYDLENKGALVSQLVPILGRYATERNDAAHTCTPRTTKTYQTPSVVLSDIKTITHIFIEIELEIMNY